VDAYDTDGKEGYGAESRAWAKVRDKGGMVAQLVFHESFRWQNVPDCLEKVGNTMAIVQAKRS
jgi:hypothetical protein